MINLLLKEVILKEIHEALQTASKRGTGRVGFPEYIGVVKKFLNSYRG